MDFCYTGIAARIFKTTRILGFARLFGRRHPSFIFMVLYRENILPFAGASEGRIGRESARGDKRENVGENVGENTYRNP